MRVVGTAMSIKEYTRLFLRLCLSPQWPVRVGKEVGGPQWQAEWIPVDASVIRQLNMPTSRMLGCLEMALKILVML
jgi:hypothetical protein